MRYASTVLLFALLFVSINSHSDEEYDINLQIKASGAPKASLIDNILTPDIDGYPWLRVVEDFFTNEWFEMPPDITPTLGKGYTWMPLNGNHDDLYAVPTFHHEIHTWDKNEYLPATDLQIHRTLKDWCVWAYGEDGIVILRDSDGELISEGHVNVYLNDDSSACFYDNQYGKSSTYDAPATAATYFGYKVLAERVVQKANFYVDIISTSLNENVYHGVFCVQIESWLTESDDYIRNGNSYLQLNTHFSNTEILIP